MQLNRLGGLLPLQRRLLLMAVDAGLLVLAVWLSFWLRLAHPWHPSLIQSIWLIPTSLLLGLPLFALSGQYKGLTRYVGSLALYELAGRTALLTLALAFLGLVSGWPLPPRSSWLLFWILPRGLCVSGRLALRFLIVGGPGGPRVARPRVVIYGAGAAGAQLAAALRFGEHLSLLAFVDDDPQLWGRSLSAVNVFPPQKLSVLPVDQVLLAIPSLQRSSRRRIVDHLQALGLTVLQVPSIEEITSGRARIDSLRPVAIEELLGRDQVPPDPQLLGPGITGKAVLVSGAGGSIGSELCRQILRLKPSRLLLLECSEPSLYAIDQELTRDSDCQVEVVPVLGSVRDAALVNSVLSNHQVQVVFHAAAYKHVPMVEANPLPALDNNILATAVIARAAINARVESFTLISTDKAVRPTNVMGATKRGAELVVQALAKEVPAESPAPASRPATRLSMVRFGNVLGSSGSVVPLFGQQIASGGPITLTHPEVIRYFMTIPEAAQLVIQSAVLGRGGDLFLLDMGEPVRIHSLAEQMVRLSGLSLRDAAHPEGDIEIVCTGMRPGEKLYEELLIDAESEPTQHPLIFRASEHFLPSDQLWPLLSRLEQAIAGHDVTAALDVLAELVPEWHRAPVREGVAAAES